MGLLENITTEKVIKIDEEAEHDFLYGKDLTLPSQYRQQGIVLVKNRNNEVLGYGLLSNENLKNLLDAGDLLRRELH